MSTAQLTFVLENTASHSLQEVGDRSGCLMLCWAGEGVRDESDCKGRGLSRQASCSLRKGNGGKRRSALQRVRRFHTMAINHIRANRLCLHEWTLIVCTQTQHLSVNDLAGHRLEFDIAALT